MEVEETRAGQRREAGWARAAVTAVFLLVGFAAVGLGISIIFPLILSAAARSRDVSSGTALAAVSRIGVALWLVALLYAGIAALTGSGDGSREHTAQEQIISSGSPPR